MPTIHNEPFKIIVYEIIISKCTCDMCIISICDCVENFILKMPLKMILLLQISL